MTQRHNTREKYRNPFEKTEARRASTSKQGQRVHAHVYQSQVDFLFYMDISLTSICTMRERKRAGEIVLADSLLKDIIGMQGSL